MKKQKSKFILLSEQWKEVNKIAIIITEDTCKRINSISPQNTPQITKEINKCEYWRQGLLELVISELGKRV